MPDWERKRTRWHDSLIGLTATVALALMTVRAGWASDWPTYRHDSARSGGTDEQIDAPLQLQWVYRALHAPEPAWPPPADRPREGWRLRNRVGYDAAYQVSVGDGRLFFGSSADDKVYALDAASGRVLWEFYTAGPVRLAPTVWNDRVLFGSDDGHVYCLRAEDGQLLWKRRGGPSEELMLGHGKMISRWPIGTSVLVRDGVAFFGAGIFPYEQVYLYAVRVEDGEPVWKRDTLSQVSAGRGELSPQGYLLAAQNRLVVPSGRGLPAAFAVSDGEFVFQRSYGWRGVEAGGAIGGTYAVLADGQIYTGTQDHLVALNLTNGATGFAWLPGRRLAVSGDMGYLASGQRLIAFDRQAYAQASRRQNQLQFQIRQLQDRLSRARSNADRQKARDALATAEKALREHNRTQVQPAIRWTAYTRAEAELIVTANAVIAGGQDRVEIFDRENGALLWSQDVAGQACGLAVADGRLYVSTDKGHIYCFGPEKPAKPLLHQVKAVPDPYPADSFSQAMSRAAATIVGLSGVKRGYALVLGAEDGHLACELAKQTELQIIGIESDPNKVRRAREYLDRAGLYGHRVVIHQGDPGALPYSSYFANLIVSDTCLREGLPPGRPELLARHLKPWGGVLCLGVPQAAASSARKRAGDQLADWIQQMGLGRPSMITTNGLWAVLRRGPLPGAGEWTHEYADSGNTACSDDRLVGGTLGLLWYGEPGSAPMVNRHDAAPAPLAVGGRMFIEGENIVMAYDSYNGLKLWERRIPGALRTRLKGVECGNLAASEDSLFVAVSNRCLRLDAATGRTLATYALPKFAGPNQTWAYVAYADGLLYGSVGKALGVSDAVFAVDPKTGKLLWAHRGTNIINLTLAVADGWFFFIDSSLSPEQRKAFLAQDKTAFRQLTGAAARAKEKELKQIDVRRAVMLDARSGGTVWSKPVDVTACSRVGIGGGELTAMYKDGILVLCGANANGHYWRQFLAGEFSQRRLVALAARDGRVLWTRDANYRHRPVIIGDRILAEPWLYDLRTGRQLTRNHPITGRETPWQFLRPGHHCGAISACPQMLLMRSGSTSYYDLIEDSGIRHFAGHRLGCWINAIPANGLVLVPEASAGCICLHPINSTIVLEPRSDYRRWAIYSTGGPNTPVQHLAVNLGAPGDRRDARGQLWLAYPRPALPSDRAAMGLKLDLKVGFAKGGGYEFVNEDDVAVPGAEEPWLFTSWARGITRCVVPVLGEKDAPATYTVRLYFTAPEDRPATPIKCDVQMQGTNVLQAVELTGSERKGWQPIVQEVHGVTVTRNLEIKLVPKQNGSGARSGYPVLCAVEIIREPAPPPPSDLRALLGG